MNKERLNNIIKGNLNLTQEDLEEIKSLTDEFPFCQIGHILSAIAHKQHEHMLSEDKIITAAVHTGNRKKLRSLINNSVQISKKEITEDKETAIPTEEEKVIDKVEQNKAGKEEAEETDKQVATTTRAEKIPTPQLLSDRKKDISKELEENLALLQKRKDDKTSTVTKESARITLPKKEETTKEKTIEKNVSKETSHVSSSRMGDEVRKSDSKSGGSFTDIMLQYLETLEEQRSNKPTKEDQLSIIDDFIEKDPNISRATPSTKTENSTDLAKDSVKLKNSFISENLAKINAKQGKISTAIDIYEQLILKYPEKKSYFAEQIEKLKQS